MASAAAPRVGVRAAAPASELSEEQSASRGGSSSARSTPKRKRDSKEPAEAAGDVRLPPPVTQRAGQTLAAPSPAQTPKPVAAARQRVSSRAPSHSSRRSSIASSGSSTSRVCTPSTSSRRQPAPPAAPALPATPSTSSGRSRPSKAQATETGTDSREGGLESSGGRTTGGSGRSSGTRSGAAAGRRPPPLTDQELEELADAQGLECVLFRELGRRLLVPEDLPSPPYRGNWQSAETGQTYTPEECMVLWEYRRTASQ